MTEPLIGAAEPNKATLLGDGEIEAMRAKAEAEILEKEKEDDTDENDE